MTWNQRYCLRLSGRKAVPEHCVYLDVLCEEAADKSVPGPVGIHHLLPGQAHHRVLEQLARVHAHHTISSCTAQAHRSLGRMNERCTLRIAEQAKEYLVPPPTLTQRRTVGTVPVPTV